MREANEPYLSVFLITRTYALWNRSKYVLWLLMGISIPVIAYTIVLENSPFGAFWGVHGVWGGIELC